MRLLGAALLASGPAIIGFCAAGRLARRPRILRQLAAALEQMEREISFRLTPLSEVFTMLSQEYSGPVGALFSGCAQEMDGLDRQPMSKLWRRALAEVSLDLEGRGLRALEELGEVLGRYDGDNLCIALKQACGELIAAAEEAEREREQKERMEQILGLTAGALLVILLV